jgi:hypothetical protein
VLSGRGQGLGGVYRDGSGSVARHVFLDAVCVTETGGPLTDTYTQAFTGPGEFENLFLFLKIALTFVSVSWILLGRNCACFMGLFYELFVFQ